MVLQDSVFYLFSHQLINVFAVIQVTKLLQRVFHILNHIIKMLNQYELLFQPAF